MGGGEGKEYSAVYVCKFKQESRDGLSKSAQYLGNDLGGEGISHAYVWKNVPYESSIVKAEGVLCEMEKYQGGLT